MKINKIWIIAIIIFGLMACENGVNDSVSKENKYLYDDITSSNESDNESSYKITLMSDNYNSILQINFNGINDNAHFENNIRNRIIEDFVITVGNITYKYNKNDYNIFGNYNEDKSCYIGLFLVPNPKLIIGSEYPVIISYTGKDNDLKNIFPVKENIKCEKL